MSMAEFYIENGIDPGDPDSFDMFVAGNERQYMTEEDWEAEGFGDAWRRAGSSLCRKRELEADEEARQMAWEQAKENARNRLAKQSLPREQQIELAEREADATWHVVGEERKWFGIPISESMKARVAARATFRETAQRQAEGVRRDRGGASDARLWPLDESELDYMAETRGWTKLDCEKKPPMASYRKADVRLNFWLSTGTVGSYLNHPAQGKTQLFRRNIDMDGAPALFDNPRIHTGIGYHTSERTASSARKRSADASQLSPPTKAAKSSAGLCRCGSTPAKACTQGCCGKCCQGPCARHKK